MRDSVESHGSYAPHSDTSQTDRLVAWLGGALFVTALVVFAYTYAIRLGRVTTGAVWRPLVVDVALFALFSLHHSLFASRTVKRWIRQRIREPLLRSSYVWVASLLLVAVCLFWQPVGGMVWAIEGSARAVPLALAATGVLLTAAGVRRLDPLELAGIRAASSGPLVTAWPYSLVRHPLYLGWFLIVFGVPTMTGSRLVMAAASSLYLVVAIPWEERRLLAAYGARYREYQGRVRWRAVPGIY